jgi:hypothetical protein
VALKVKSGVTAAETTSVTVVEWLKAGEADCPVMVSV